MSESKQSADADTTVEPTTSNDDGDDAPEYWVVEEDGYRLERVSYSTYELGYDGISIQFDGIRDPDDDAEDEYELRDGYDTLGYFDPSDEAVPETVGIAFLVLAHEI